MEKQLKETFNYSAEDVPYINNNESATRPMPRSAPINVERLTLNRRSLAVGKGNDRL